MAVLSERGGSNCEREFCEGLSFQEYHHTDVQVKVSVAVRRGTVCNSGFEVYVRRTTPQVEIRVSVSRGIAVAPRQRCRQTGHI